LIRNAGRFNNTRIAHCSGISQMRCTDRTLPQQRFHLAIVGAGIWFPFKSAWIPRTLIFSIKLILPIGKTLKVVFPARNSAFHPRRSERFPWLPSPARLSIQGLMRPLGGKVSRSFAWGAESIVKAVCRKSPRSDRATRRETLSG